MDFDKMTQEQLDKLPIQLKLRLGYMKLTKEKAEQQQQQTIELQDGDKAVTPLELIKLGMTKQLKQEEKEGLSD